MSQTETELTTNGSTSTSVPPYGSFKTVMNLIERMAEEGGVPSRIDRSYLSNLPGSVQSTTMHALKSLDLVDEELHPTPTLVEIVEKPNERKSLFAGLIREKYASQLALGTRATTSQLERSLREAGIQGSTLRKAIAFFLAAARWADVPISPHFKTPRIPPTERKPRKQEPAPELEPEIQKPPPPTQTDLHPFIKGLVDSLPEPGSGFPTDKQEAWFDTARGIFRLIYTTGSDSQEARLTLTPSSEEGSND